MVHMFANPSARVLDCLYQQHPPACLLVGLCHAVHVRAPFPRQRIVMERVPMHA